MKELSWLILAVTATGTFMATLDSSIVNVALPLMATELKVDISEIQWVVTAYLLTIVSLLLIFGRLGDRISRRKLYSFGIFAFTLGSWGCGSSQNLATLIIFRIVQGIGASCMMAISPAIVAAAFPGTNRGRALGLLGTVVALGTMTGPVLGGFILAHGTWSLIFLINIPLGLLGIIMAWNFIPDMKQQKGGMNIKGSIWLALAINSSLMVLLEGWLLFALIAPLCFWLFYQQEQKTDRPIFDRDIWYNHLFLYGTGASFFSFMAIFSNVILLPFYLFEILAITPAQMGLIMIPYPFMMAIFSPLGGYLSEKVSFVKITVSGLGILSVGLISTHHFTSQTSLWEVVLSQAIMGMGTGLFQSANNNSVISSVRTDQLGLAAGISAFIRNLGMVTGVAFAVFVFDGVKLYGQQDFLTAYHFAMTFATFYALISLWFSYQRKTEVPRDFC